MKKVIVTGGAGFIGSNLVDELINLGVETIVIDNLSTGYIENINPKSTFYNLDISDSNNYKILDSIFNGVDIVFHLAAKARVQPSIKDPIEYNNTNVNGTLNILTLSVKNKIKKVIFSSSSSVYGDSKVLPLVESLPNNPLSPYALQKQIGEDYCKLFGILYNLETVCLRYFNVYGERQPLNGSYRTVIGIFMNQKKENKNLTITNDGQQKRDFTYVGDVVNANILAAKSDKKMYGEIFNIGRGKNFTINQIAYFFNQKVEFIDKVIEPFETLSNSNKANNELNWAPKMDVDVWLKKVL